MSFAASSLNDALARLSAAMGINNLVGLADQAAYRDQPSVVWRPARLRYQRPHEQPSDGRACSEVWITCDVEIIAPDWSGLEVAANKLEVALYEEFSENTFQRSSDVEIEGGGVENASFGAVGQISLLFPVYTKRFGKANITAIEQSGTLKGPLGNEETIP